MVAAIPASGRLRQKDCKLESSLGYIVKPCWKTRPGKREHNFSALLTTSLLILSKRFKHKVYPVKKKIRENGTQ